MYDPKGGKMRRCLFFSIALFGWFLSAAGGYGAEPGSYIVQTAQGHINWTKGWVQAGGVGKAPGSPQDSALSQSEAVEGALIAARKNLLHLLKSIPIHSGKSVGQYLNEKPDIEEKLMAFIESLRPPEPHRIQPDGSAVVRLHMPLYGPFAQLILPPDIQQIDPIRRVSPIRPAPEPPPADDAKKDSSNDSSKPPEPVHSGMIVDAKGLSGVEPELVPQIVDEAGKEIYGPAFVSREYAIQSGMAGYMKDMVSAREDLRVKPNPLIVKGLRTEGPETRAIVVSNADASKLRHASEHLTFLKQCRVIILLD